MSKLIKDLIKDIDVDLNSFLTDFKNELENQTPVRTGRAKKGWKKKGRASVNRDSDSVVITNDVDYVAVLDTGTSDQAPNGIIEPALKKALQKAKRKI